MNNEEVLDYSNLYHFTPYADGIQVATYPNYEYYSRDMINFNLRDKIMDEIKCNIEKLGEAYDVVSSKEDKYFIKGQIAALSEMKYRIEKDYWSYLRGGE